MADDKSLNLDPITDEPGAHPVGTGLGAAVGGVAAGAAIGAVGGPLGAIVGGAVGAVAGGLGGKAVAESINPTLEEAYWRENYQGEPYFEAGRTYDDYGPAYRLGWSARDSYPGQFEEIEGRLENDWGTRRDTSSLTWPQARAASRAAWERTAYQTEVYPAGQVAWADTIATGQPADSDEVVDTLNELLEACRDGEYGFTATAEHAKSGDLKAVLARHAGECREAAAELQGLIRQLGGTADEGGSMSGALHRGWVAVRGTLGGYTDQAMLDECERGEDSAVASYRKALRTTLPVTVRSVVERQAQGAQRNHDEIKALRDAHRATTR